MLPTTLLFAFVGLIMLWALVAAIEIRPIWVGISITCGAEVILVVAAIFLINATGIEFNAIKPYVDEIIVKQAWLDSKRNLIEMLSLGNRSDFVSYETWWRRRFSLRQYINAKRGKRAYFDFPDTPEFRLDKDDLRALEGKSLEDIQSHFRDKVADWADLEDVNLDSIPSCLSYLYDIDEDVRSAYLAEYETIVQFQLIILQSAKSLADQEKKYIFKFIAEKRAVLYLVGISIDCQTAGSLDERFAAVMSDL